MPTLPKASELALATVALGAMLVACVLLNLPAAASAAPLAAIM